MKNVDIDNIIESVNCDKKEEMRAQLHSRLDISQTEEPQPEKRRRFFDVKTAVLGAVSICAVCLAIVLPIALRNEPTNTPPSDRYYYSESEFSRADLGCTIKDYSEQTGKDILYIDWYDLAEASVTEKVFLKDNKKDIIYITEDLYHRETGDHVYLAVTEEHNHVKTLDIIRDSCFWNYEYNNVNIKWSYDSLHSRAYFEYNGYKYYVQWFMPDTEEGILDIVKEILDNK
ncbi:MAG: hypothetical protein K2K13_05610 [Clostridiales bacterium]|nr:hypothetical protein [Clostridiales bacterium]